LNKELAARAEAAAWITRLHGSNRTAEMEAGFRKWLSESAENRAEFNGLTDIWAAVGTLPVGGIPRLERWEHSAESLELQRLRRHLQESPSRWRTTLPWRARGVTVALLAAACVLVLAASWTLQNRSESSYGTDVGEQRLVQMADKSRIWLNSETRVRISIDSRRRRVELIRGEALFEVSPDASRPFVVVVSGHLVTALGTSFVVRYEPDHTAVTLVDGRVAIDSASPSSGSGTGLEHARREEGVDAGGSAARRDAAVGSPWLLSPGERLTFEPAGDVKIDAPSVDAVLAWRRGEIVLNDTPLQDALSEMNHYDKTTLVIEDPALASISVSGLYHTGDNAGFARALAKMYGLDLDQRQGRIYLKSHPGEPFYRLDVPSGCGTRVWPQTASRHLTSRSQEIYENESFQHEQNLHDDGRSHGAQCHDVGCDGTGYRHVARQWPYLYGEPGATLGGGAGDHERAHRGCPAVYCWKRSHSGVADVANGVAPSAIKLAPVQMAQ